MKRFFALCICLACFYPATAFAATVTDDFSSLEGTAWRSYRNLNASPHNLAAELGWASAPDFTALSIASPLTVASALYAVENAQSLQVAIYSNFSTVAEKRGGSYYLGSFHDSDASTRARVRLGADGSSLYLHAGDENWLEARRLPDTSFMFATTSSPPKATESYGLTVLCSPNNQSFSALSASLTGITNAQENGGDYSYFYETYSVSLPAGTRFVRLELREARAFALEGGGLQTNIVRGSLRFARAQFTGGAAAWGVLAEAPPDSGGSPPPGGGIITDPDLQKPGPSEAEESAPMKKRASSSEEEERESASRADSRTSRAAVKGSVTSAAKPNSPADEPTAQENDEERAFTEPNRAAVKPWSGAESANSRAAFGAVYIALAGVLLAALARRSRR